MIVYLRACQHHMLSDNGGNCRPYPHMNCQIESVVESVSADEVRVLTIIAS